MVLPWSSPLDKVKGVEYEPCLCEVRTCFVVVVQSVAIIRINIAKFCKSVLATVA